jgi:hypothetical protein
VTIIARNDEGRSAVEQAEILRQADVARRGIGLRLRALLDAAVTMLGKIGTYATPCVEDEAAMHFFLTLDHMDWYA